MRRMGTDPGAQDGAVPPEAAPDSGTDADASSNTPAADVRRRHGPPRCHHPLMAEGVRCPPRPVAGEPGDDPTVLLSDYTDGCSLSPTPDNFSIKQSSDPTLVLVGQRWPIGCTGRRGCVAMSCGVSSLSRCCAAQSRCSGSPLGWLLCRQSPLPDGGQAITEGFGRSGTGTGHRDTHPRNGTLRPI